MKWSKAVGALAVLAVGVWTVGAIVSLVVTGLSGQYQTPSAAVVAIVGIAVLGTAAVGARSRRWLANADGHYW